MTASEKVVVFSDIKRLETYNCGLPTDRGGKNC